MDESEMWREYRAAKQDQHAARREEGTVLIRRAGIPFTVYNDGAVLLIREHGRPKVDYYPSTGRWRVARCPETFRGGAVAFIAWYRKQGEAG